MATKKRPAGLRADSTAQRLAAAEAQCLKRDVHLSDVARATYGMLLDAATPLTAYDLIAALQKLLARRLHPPTIYRALSFLLEQGLVHRLESTNAYMACIAPERPHDGIHFLCNACGSVEEAVDLRVHKLLDQDASLRDFAPAQPMIEVRGLCRDCRAPTPAISRR